MSEEKISKAYAKSITDLCDSSNINAADELTKLQELINNSNDLENLIFLDVFTIEEKLSVMNEVISKLELSKIIRAFIQFLLEEKRISILPLIYKEVVVLDDERKGFLRGYIEGSDEELNEEFKTRIVNFLEEKLGKKTELDYVKSDLISAGYKVTVGDLQLDASLENQLNRFKNEIVNS